MPRRFLFLPMAFVAVALLGGCRVRARVVAPAPAADVQLVSVGPNTWVVADYDDPVFFYDGFYWRYYGGGWYRSNYLGGWASVNVAVVPPPIVRIDRPRRYRRYRAPRGARVRVVPRPAVRARGARVRVRQDRRVQRRVDRRDRRIERRQDRRVRRQDRRDRRIERRQDRRRGPRRGSASGARVRVRPN